MAQDGQWGITGGIAGRSFMDRLRPGECGGRAFCLCYHWNGAERPEEQIVLKWEQMHWAVRGRAMTRHRGARHTPSRLLYPSPWLRGPPSFPFRGSLETWEYFSPYGNVPKELLLMQIPAGLGAARAVVEGREALAAVSYSPGETEIMGISPPTLPSQVNLCLDLKTLHQWWNPSVPVGPAAQGWWWWKAARAANTERNSTKSFSTLYCTKFRCIYFNKLQSQVRSTSLL